MKVLVMSEERMFQLQEEDSQRHRDYNTVHINEVENAMTEVEIPDGCVLAVVDKSKGIDSTLLKQEVKL